MKKGLLFLVASAFLFSCSNYKNLPSDDVYFRGEDKEEYVVKKESPLPERNSFLSTRLFYTLDRDSDFDGIVDWADPLPYTFGPYVDTDGNGVPSYLDHSVCYDNWGFPSDFYWNNFYWNNFYYSPFVFQEENVSQFNSHRKGSLGTTIPPRESQKNFNTRRRESPIKDVSRESFGNQKKAKEYFPLNRRILQSPKEFNRHSFSNTRGKVHSPPRNSLNAGRKKR